MNIVRERGFTLFEILVVIVIISIVAAGATLTISHNRQWQQKALVEEVIELLSFAQEYALLQPATVQVIVNSHSLQFYKWIIDEKNNGNWVPLNDAFLHDHAISPDYYLQLQLIANSTEESEKNHNTILISSSGDWTPFNLYIGQTTKIPSYQIQGLRGGGLELHEMNE